eukprot:gene23970-30256_t
MGRSEPIVCDPNRFTEEYLDSPNIAFLAVDDDASASADESDSNDPNEVFCTCRRVSFGDMVACDNEKCAIEWFHYGCVNLQKKPRNAWLCPDCTALQSIAT